MHNLACFRLAYESGSIGKAAKQAYLTRQGLSGVLKTMEAELGQALFERTARGLEPTEFARGVYPHVVTILEAYDEIERLGKAHQVSQRVGIAVAYGALLSVPLDEIVEEFERTHPGIALDLDTVEPTFAVQCIAEGSKDIALIVGALDEAGAECCALRQVPLCAAVRADLLPEGKTGIDALAGLTWLGLHEAFPFDAALVELSRERNLDLAMSFEWHDYHLILDQMRQGKGACVVPARCAERFRAQGIAIIELNDPRLTWEVNIMSPRARALSPAARTALAWLKAHLSTLPPLG